jgi:uncharacterized phage protein gp47/JayE
MAQLPTQTFTALVRGQVAAIQGAASGLIDFTIGSILRAVVESVSQVVLWLQGLIIQLLTVTRLATSTGTDVDTWGTDFDLPRLPAATATTEETFGRFSATQQAVVPIGSSVETADGSQQYVVIIDYTNRAYSNPLGGYVLPIGTLSINCPVQASVAGSGGNCVPGAINTITSSIPGVDFCTNAAAVENGQDAETDAAYKIRFIAWINSLSRAVKAAINLAVISTQLNVTCSLVENMAYNGNPQPGFFYVVANDGTGNPPQSLLNAIGQAVESVRGFTITYAIFPPVIIPATVSMSITVGIGFDVTTTITAVENAISVYMAQLNLGQAMPWSRLAQLAYDASPGVLDVLNIRLNGAQADIAPTNQQVIELTSISVVST